MIQWIRFLRHFDKKRDTVFITWDLKRYQENHETGMSRMDRIEEI